MVIEYIGNLIDFLTPFIISYVLINLFKTWFRSI